MVKAKLPRNYTEILVGRESQMLNLDSSKLLEFQLTGLKSAGTALSRNTEELLEMTPETSTLYLVSGRVTELH